jgi:hypothetical protein
MADREALARWTDAYIGAWDSNDPGEICGLFTEDARYLTEPHARPWTGQDEIVAEWLARKDEPGDHTFRWEILAMAGALGFVRGWTSYPTQDPPVDYGNLWVIRLEDDGRASEFTEWWVRVKDTTPPFPE